MGLFFHHIINSNTKLGIWHISETEDFFLQEVSLQRSITHSHKRLQHLAGRYLLKYLFPDFPNHEILIADTRKPYLPYEQYHFSISHCSDYAAAIVSNVNRVGIDIEIPSEKVQRIKHKFLNKEEEFLVSGFPLDDYMIDYAGQVRSSKPETTNYKPETLIWSAKEAIFKWYSLGDVDFRKHIHLNNKISETNNEWLQLPFLFLKDEVLDITVYSKNFQELVLSYCIS